MPFDIAKVVSEIDALIHQSSAASLQASDSDQGRALVARRQTQVVACIERFSPPGSAYRTNLARAQGGSNYSIANPYTLGLLVGVLQGLREDIAEGRLVSFAELIHADLFSDFLEGAEYLLSEGWKDASVVIIGSVLEEHLRKLADKVGVPVSDNGNQKGRTVSMPTSRAPPSIQRSNRSP